MFSLTVQDLVFNILDESPSTIKEDDHNYFRGIGQDNFDYHAIHILKPSVKRSEATDNTC